MRFLRSSSWLSRFGTAALAVSSLTLACGGGDGTSTGGAIALSVSPTSGTVPQGGSIQLTGTITRSGGFTGTVTFAVTGTIPAGLTGTVSNISTSGDVTTATITLATTTATPPGTYPITVTGSGSGVSSASVTFTLTVTAASEGSYTLSLNPAVLSIAQGASQTTTLTIARTNFTGAITLTAENLPSGVTATFNPASPVAGNSTVITLTASSTATVGTSTITIRGSTPGAAPGEGGQVNALADRTVTLALTITATSAGSYTLSATPSSLSVAPGGSGSSTINVNRTGGFAASVALAVAGAPANMTATLNPGSTTGSSSTLNITTTAQVAPGSYPLTITGTAAGVANQTTTVTVTVTAAANFTLSATPGALSFAQGGGGNSTININRTGGFSANVALTVSGQPANMTATLNPTSTGGNTSTLTITTTSAVPVGVHVLTITGTAAGVANQTTTVTVTVTAPGGAGNVTVSFANCAANARAIWFAGLDGTVWTRIVGVNDVYTFSVNSSKGGWAYVTQNGANFTVIVFLAAQPEITGAAVNLCGVAPPPGKTIFGSVTGFGSGLFGQVNVGLGGAIASANAGAPNFTLQNVADGPNDLIAWRTDLVAGPSASDRGLVMRGLNPNNNANLGTLDLAGGSSFAAATATAMITGLSGGEAITGGMNYLTGPACRIASLYGFISGSANQPMFGFPAAQQQATDFHNFTVFASTGTFPTVQGRTHTEAFQALANRTIALAPVYTGTVTSLGGNYKRLQVVATIPSAYLTSGASLTYTTQDGSHAVAITATPTWIGGTALTLALDNFSGLAGWMDSWAPPSGATVNYNSAVAGQTFTTTFCSEGAIIRSAFFTGQL